MRQFSLPQSRPPTLEPDGLGGRAAARHVERKSRDPNGSLGDLPDHWKKPDVRGVLYARQGRVCGYCGRELPDNDPGQVDHFRPKGRVRDDDTHGGYWWLAYALNNLIMSCSLCNGPQGKWDRFPLRRQARRRATYGSSSTDQPEPREARLLLHPAIDPVESWVEFVLRRGRCRVHPGRGLTRSQKEQVTGTIQRLRLNRYSLTRQRTRVWDDVQDAIDRNDTDFARDAAVRFRPHSAVACQVLAINDVSPPTATEELLWFLAQLLQEMEDVLDSADYESAKVVKEQLDQLDWTAAALWKDPPVGDADTMQTLLDRFGLRDELVEFFRQL